VKLQGAVIAEGGGVAKLREDRAAAIAEKQAKMQGDNTSSENGSG